MEPHQIPPNMQNPSVANLPANPAAVDPQVAGPVSVALAGEKQPAASSLPAPADLAGTTIEPEQEPRSIKGGQIAWHAVKLLGVLIAAPIAAPYAVCFFIGWTGAAFFNSKSGGEFGTDVAAGVGIVFKPITRQWQGAYAGLGGMTGKEYRHAMKMMESQSTGPESQAAASSGLSAGTTSSAGAPPAGQQSQVPLQSQPNQPSTVEEERRKRDAENLQRQREEQERQAAAARPPPQGLQPPPPNV